MHPLSKKIISYLKQFKNVSAAYLFGSQVSGKVTDQSDVDIAILFDPKKKSSALELYKMKNELEALLHQSVDLVSLNQTNPILAHQILKKGHRFFLKSKRHVSSFIARHVVDYDDIKRLRAPIEKRWLNGAVHG